MTKVKMHYIVYRPHNKVLTTYHLPKKQQHTKKNTRHMQTNKHKKLKSLFKKSKQSAYPTFLLRLKNTIINVLTTKHIYDTCKQTNTKVKMHISQNQKTKCLPPRPLHYKNFSFLKQRLPFSFVVVLVLLQWKMLCYSVVHVQ